MQEDQPDAAVDLLKDYLDWALYRQLRLEHSLSYGPWSEREVLGGVGFLKARLLKDGLDPATFARLQQAAIARQAWAVQGNSALADYYWGALGDYEDGHFSNPAKALQAVTLKDADKAMRKLFAQPGYLRIEKPLFSYDQLMWLGAGLLALLILIPLGWRAWRRR